MSHQPPAGSSGAGRLLGRLQSGLNYLDGAFKDTIEAQQGQGEEPPEELVEGVAAQRLQVCLVCLGIGGGAGGVGCGWWV